MTALEEAEKLVEYTDEEVAQRIRSQLRAVASELAAFADEAETPVLVEGATTSAVLVAVSALMRSGVRAAPLEMLSTRQLADALGKQHQSLYRALDVWQDDPHDPTPSPVVCARGERNVQRFWHVFQLPAWKAWLARHPRGPRLDQGRQGEDAQGWEQ